MARYFDAGRGRAIAIASLGYASGEAILPLIAVIAIAHVGWRSSFLGAAAVLALVLFPVILMLLRGHSLRHQSYLARLAAPAAEAGIQARSWTRGEVLRDLHFYMLLPGATAPAMIATAMFFHHLNLADAKGWSHQWITGSYVIYAIATMFASLVSGPLIDRLGATRLVPIMLVPLTLAMLLVASFDSAWVVWPYFMLLGMDVGIAHTAISAIWAELYGLAHLGAIKSLATALSVFATALGPVIMGGLMDRGASMDTVCVLFAVYTVLALVLILIVVRTPRAHL
jgi:predicted MFS family arabinose efflux permease